MGGLWHCFSHITQHVHFWTWKFFDFLRNLERIIDMIHLWGYPVYLHISGWWFQSLWKIWKSDWIIIPAIGENKTCSKPPSRRQADIHYITLQHITVQYMTLLLYLYLAKRCQMAVKHPNMWWIDGRLVAWGSVDPLWKRTAFSGDSVYPVCIQKKSQKTWIEFLEFRISKRGLWKQALTLTPPKKMTVGKPCRLQRDLFCPFSTVKLTVQCSQPCKRRCYNWFNLVIPFPYST